MTDIVPTRQVQGISGRFGAAAAAICTLLTGSSGALADEGGVSFWLPGQYGSFAAIAPEPGFSLALQSYAYTGSVDADRAIGRGGELTFGLDTSFLAQFFVPTWTPDTTFLGARASFSLAFFPGMSDTSAKVGLGGLSADTSSKVSGWGDLYPTAQLFWNDGGAHNWMAYLTGNIPVGDYDPDRLSNIGLGHGAIDIGGAYTYLDAKTGWEFSATTGATYNFENPDTDYTSGIDWHLDVGASRFLNEKLFAGLVGFAYVQLTEDDGQPEALGGFKSRTFGIGPQIGYTFDAGGVPIYTNLRGYYEFDTRNRPEGGGVFLTVNIPISTSGGA